ncbi:uncharacterized protein LOC106643401 [Copidosoma floridanum]|uniref:uncharacterized protein LOC106643401 n=1 Tax=Copidosoma floridanum TaxID=29053 RepID=UPI0006C99AA2|nr:uncharacterized protein LOC106643401 [Copidosoma floridanum]
MARLSYECVNATKAEDPKPFPCSSEKMCLYCPNPQCCFIMQRRPPKHFWETWYFWLGVVLLLIIVLSTVGTYVVSSCKHNLQAIGYSVGSRNNAGSGNSRISTISRSVADVEEQQQLEEPNNRHEISINIIPTSAVLPTHRKIMFIAPQSSYAHLTPIVA